MKRKVGPRAETYASMAERDAAKSGARKPAANGRKNDDPADWVTNTVSPEKALSAIVKALARGQQRRLWDNTFFMSLYANVDFMSSYYAGGGESATESGAMPRMSNNLIRVCVDSLCGKLVQANSRIVFQTRDGDWSEWRKARKLEMAVEGEFARMKLYREVKQVLVDAINQGDGYLKLYTHEKTVCCERVFPNEVFVDELEAAYGAPKKMYHLRYARKEDVLAWFPEKAVTIQRAACTIPPRFAWTLYKPGMVEIYEAWALPVGDRPGRHLIAISSGVLVDEEWDKPYFPIIRFKGGDRPFGWYGAGMTEQVASTQIDLNKTLTVMQRAAHLGIAPYWVVPEGSSVNIDHLTNHGGHIVQTSAGEPKWVTNPPFHPAARDYVDMLQQMIMTFFGMNEMETTGELPINRLDSSEALTEFQNMGSIRHTMLLERWQEFFVEVAERVCMLAVDLARTYGGYPVLIKKAYAKANQLDWKDLELERDAYTLQPAPSNILPLTQAGKTDRIEKWAEKGLISQVQAARLLVGPTDIEAVLNEVAADEDDIDRLIEQFTEFEEYRAPSPLQNLPRALERVTASRLKYANLGAPDSVIKLFDRYLADAKDLLETLQQPSAVGIPNGQPASPTGSLPAAPAAATDPAAPASGDPAAGSPAPLPA